MLRNIVGGVARGDDFYDREELIERLWGRLEAGNVLLAAPRRFGKTSLMYQLLDEPKPGWQVVHVDAESIREPVNFVIALLDALMLDRRLRRFLRDRWEKTCKWLREFLSEVEVKGSGSWDVSAKIRFKKVIEPHWQERGEALLRALRGYDKEKRLLIIIDELPVMLHLFRDNQVSDAETRAFLHWFRRVRTDPNVGLTDCRFLVGGSVGIEHYLSRLGVSASFNAFERLALPELSKEAAAGLLGRLLKSQHLGLSPVAERKVLSLIGKPIPYFIQVSVAEIAAARATTTGQFGPAALERIYRERILGATCKSYFQHYYDRLRYYDKPQEQAAKGLLKELALARPKAVPVSRLRAIYRRVLAEGAADDDFAALLDDLENDFYIERHKTGRNYVFASKILCDWWRRYYAF